MQPVFGADESEVAVNLTTGQRTKLCNSTSISKVNNQLVKLDTTTFNVFTGQACSLIPSGWMPQTIADRGLVLASASSGTSFYRAVIDTQTGSTLSNHQRNTMCKNLEQRVIDAETQWGSVNERNL
ncbi:hypothetical protein Pelo_19089 [Pelomyxa schiedti]|nr:hypothetical protein Pelo_19089 [Pelomyxa schiedti]